MSLVVSSFRIPSTLMERTHSQYVLEGTGEGVLSSASHSLGAVHRHQPGWPRGPPVGRYSLETCFLSLHPQLLTFPMPSTQQYCES